MSSPVQSEVSDAGPRRWQTSKLRGSRLIVCRTVLVMQDKAKAKSASRELASLTSYTGRSLVHALCSRCPGSKCVQRSAAAVNCTLKGEQHSIDAGEARLGAFPDQRAAVQFPFRRAHGHPVHNPCCPWRPPPTPRVNWSLARTSLKPTLRLGHHRPERCKFPNSMTPDSASLPRPGTT
jgi:hypothetical protein